MVTKLLVMIFLIISGFYARITFVVASGQHLRSMPPLMSFNSDKMSSCALDAVPSDAPVSYTCHCFCPSPAPVAPSPCLTCPKGMVSFLIIWVGVFLIGIVIGFGVVVTYEIVRGVRGPKVQSKALAGNEVDLIKLLGGLETQRFNKRYQVLGGLETQQFNQRYLPVKKLVLSKHTY